MQVYKIPPRVGASGWRSGEWRVNDKVAWARGRGYDEAGGYDGGTAFWQGQVNLLHGVAYAIQRRHEWPCARLPWHVQSTCLPGHAPVTLRFASDH